MNAFTADLDLDLIRCFVAVAESGGFTSGAKRLRLTQSAVSLKIQRLETLLDRRVFIRTSRSLQVTPEGELLLDYAGRMLALNQEMIQRIADPAIEGILKLGVVEHFGQQFLPDLLAQFKKGRPNVRLIVEVAMTQDLMNGLEEGQFDLVIATTGQTPRSSVKPAPFIQERVLVREPLVWAQGPRSPIDLKENPIPLVLFSPPCEYRKLAFESLEKIGRPWQVVYSSSSLTSLQAAVRAGLGITVLGQSALGPKMEPIPAKHKFPKLPETSDAIYRRQSLDPLARHLSNFIGEAVDRWQAVHGSA